jgi:hypothetical protein
LNSFQRSFLKKCQIKVKKAKWSKHVGERGGERRWGEKVWREVGGEKVGSPPAILTSISTEGGVLERLHIVTIVIN